MRILLVSPGFPVPGEAGSPRTFQLARELAARHAIDLLVVTPGAAAEPAMLGRYRGPESPFRAVSVAPVERDARTARHRLANAVRGDPWFATRRLRPAEHAAALRAVAAAARDCDVIWVDTLAMVQYAAGTGLPLVVDEVDYVGRLVGAEARFHPSRSGRLLGRLRASLVRRYERRTLRAAAAVVLISPVEATLLERDLRVPVDVVRNGCDTDHFAPSAGVRRLRGAPSLLFVGNLAYGPNHDAARFIIDQLAPAVSNRFPDARIHVVGPPADIAAPAGSPVEVAGFVDDIRPWYAGADIFLCPLRFGAGLKNKVLEAAAMGCVIVASDVAVEGTGFRDGEHYVQAGTPQEYVERLSALLADADRRAALSAAARAAVVANYSWAQAGAAFEAILDRAVRRGR
jgi:glycosyltransferase involved in cell wall biosynthesis